MVFIMSDCGRYILGVQKGLQLSENARKIGDDVSTAIPNRHPEVHALKLFQARSVTWDPDFMYTGSLLRISTALN